MDSSRRAHMRNRSHSESAAKCVSAKMSCKGGQDVTLFITVDRTEKCICTDIAILAYYFRKFNLFALLNEITSQYLIKD